MAQRREQSIFEACLDLSPPERSPFLDEACAGDDRLRERIERLLRAHQQAEIRTSMLAPALGQPLEDPQEIGPFKILQRIGEGGMGVVYLAEQTRPFRRRVALKLIKVGLDTREVIARFDSERQALALMNHPNIARILDAGATERGRPYFVMEYVRGTPLIAYCDGRRMDIDSRLRLFGQVCAAVRHAHQKGVIHRDLKPTNILVAEEDGQAVPKIIDFGVAKATNQRLTEMTVYTELGRIIGTLEYMSPEQADLSSLDVDTRSDVYSLGVILYELMTGTRPFEFKDTDRNYAEIQRILSEESPEPPAQRVRKVVEIVPSIARSRGTTAAGLVRRVSGELEWISLKAMAKDPRQRYQSARELAGDIENVLANRPLLAGPPDRLYRAVKMVRRHALGAALSGAAVVAAGLALAVLLSSAGWIGIGSDPVPVVRTSIDVGPALELWEGASRPLAIAPDGSRVIFSALPDGLSSDGDQRSRLYSRTLDAFEPRPLRGTEAGRSPTFSPDGRWIAFFAEGSLSKIPAEGGVAERIARAGLSPRGVSWSNRDEILFSLDSTPGLQLVPASGGPIETVWEPDIAAGEIELVWPQWLPGPGRRALATLRREGDEGRLTEVVLLDFDRRTRHTLRSDARQASYLTTGHLVYVRDGHLEAVEFDLDTLESGEAARVVVEDLWIYPQGAAYFALSDSGSLAYAPPPGPQEVRLDQVPHANVGLELPEGVPGWPRVAPTGNRAALHVATTTGREIWILDLNRPGSMRQLTFEGGGFPTWSADGRQIAFMSRRDGSGDIYVVAADGSTIPRRVVGGSRTQIPVSWSRQGVLAYYEIAEATQRDIWVVDLSAGTEPEPFVGTTANEFSPVFSPDGNWLAYVSDETGQNEVYIRRYPAPGPVVSISIAGGSEPVWNTDEELLYRNRNAIMGVLLESNADRSTLTAARPVEVFKTTMIRNPGNPSYSVFPDGRNFLMLRTEGRPASQQLRLILNLSMELTAGRRSN